MTNRTRYQQFARTITALVAAVGLSACGTPPPKPAPDMTLLGPRPTVRQQRYLLRPGDLLSVKFYQNPELNEDVVIRPDGMISLQIIGEIKAADVSPSDLAHTLKKRYTGELATPAVSVIVRTLASERVYVGGEVAKPGAIALSNGLTAFQAIQEAGSFLTTAHRKQVILIRQGDDGRPSGFAMDLQPVAKGLHPEEDVALAPLDVVYVPRSKVANVNLFVEQYIRNNLPITPGFAVTP